MIGTIIELRYRCGHNKRHRTYAKGPHPAYIDYPEDCSACDGTMAAYKAAGTRDEIWAIFEKKFDRNCGPGSADLVKTQLGIVARKELRKLGL